MLNHRGATDRPVGFVLAFGVIGGAALITTVLLSHRGPWILLPYAAIVLACAALLRAEGVHPFGRRFALHLGAFMASTVVVYLFIGVFDARTLMVISLVGHAWRIALMLAIGSVLSLAVAQLTARRTIDRASVAR